jgi:hypothetical protein
LTAIGSKEMPNAVALPQGLGGSGNGPGDQFPDEECVLVIVGADEYGRKELLAMTDGFRESTQSWREVLLDLRRRGLTQDPKLVIGDGALGFWTALREVFATTREQRCWVHGEGMTATGPKERPNDERSQCVAAIGAGRGEGPSARHLAGRVPRKSRGGLCSGCP